MYSLAVTYKGLTLDILLRVVILHLNVEFMSFSIAYHENDLYSDIYTIPVNNFMEDRNSSTKVSVYETVSSIICLKYMMMLPIVNVRSTFAPEKLKLALTDHE